jgi:hypothetical protein
MTEQRDEREALEKQLGQVTQRLQEANARIAALDRAAGEQRRQFEEEQSRAQATIRRLKGCQRELMQANAQATALLASSRAELEAQRSSTSWRITEPIRRCKHGLLWVKSTALRLSGFAARSENPKPPAGAREPAAAKGRVTHPQPISSIRTPADIAVILHLHYTELFDEISACIRNVPQPYHLYVSVTDLDSFERIAQAIVASHPQSEIRPAENRGRDILPMLEVLPRIVATYPYACKVHTKKSLHSSLGTQWRKDLLMQLLGSPEQIEAFIACFRAFPDLGLIGPDGHRLTDDRWWRRERDRVMDLAQRMSVPQEHLELDFFAGSMFWFRPAALKPLAGLGLTAGDFPPENGQIEGTLANALERCFSMSAKTAGFRVTDAAHAIVAARSLAQAGRAPQPAV